MSYTLAPLLGCSLSQNRTFVFSVFTFRELSAELLQMIPDNYILLTKLCAFYPGSDVEINKLHERVSRFVWDVNFNNYYNYDDCVYVLFVIPVWPSFIRRV